MTGGGCGHHFSSDHGREHATIEIDCLTVTVGYFYVDIAGGHATHNEVARSPSLSRPAADRLEVGETDNHRLRRDLLLITAGEHDQKVYEQVKHSRNFIPLKAHNNRTGLPRCILQFNIVCMYVQNRRS